jgi:hypothetical protein
MSIVERIPHDVSEDVTFRIQQYSHAVDDLVKLAYNSVVTTKSEAEVALELAARSKSVMKKIESTRKEIIEPHRKFVSQVNYVAKSFSDRLKEVEDTLKAKIDSWKNNEERSKHEKQEKAAAFLEVLGISGNVIPFDECKNLRSESATSYEREVMDFSIEDISKVPLEYLVVNFDKVKLAMKMGVTTIPGLTITKESKTIIRSR